MRNASGLRVRMVRRFSAGNFESQVLHNVWKVQLDSRTSSSTDAKAGTVAYSSKALAVALLKPRWNFSVTTRLGEDLSRANALNVVVDWWTSRVIMRVGSANEGTPGGLALRSRITSAQLIKRISAVAGRAKWDRMSCTDDACMVRKVRRGRMTTSVGGGGGNIRLHPLMENLRSPGLDLRRSRRAPEDTVPLLRGICNVIVCRL